MGLVPLRRRPLRAAHPLETRTVQVHGHRRAFVCTGSGPGLLLIHGIGSSKETWDQVVAELARDHTVIAPDLLGHGESAIPRGDYSLGGYASAMRDLLTVLDLDRVTVVGHSLGGGVAMQFAYQFPERCERVVLVDAGGVATDVHPLLRLLSVPGIGLAATTFTRTPGRHVAAALGRAAARLPLRATTDLDELVTVMEGLSRPGSGRAFLRLLRTVIDAHGQAVTMLDRSYLTRGMPMLLLWGEDDTVIPASHAYRAHDAMPGSRLVVVPGAGHFPHREEPSTFVAELRDFLATTTPAPYERDAWRRLLVDGPTAADRAAAQA